MKKSGILPADGCSAAGLADGCSSAGLADGASTSPGGVEVAIEAPAGLWLLAGRSGFIACSARIRAELRRAGSR
jgi:hypothetical protein